jgi:hypothetical protein
VFDFRYHALSLVAVFLALGIGILLGVTIGDSLVSEAERGVRQSLRGDVVEARDEVRELRRERELVDRWVERAVPSLVAAELDGERVAIVGIGGLPDDVASPVADAVEAAGGIVDSRVEVETPVDERELADAIGGRFARLGADARLLEALGRAVGRSIVRGGSVARSLARRFPERFGGDLEGADAVVVYRQPEEEASDATETFVDALIAGLRAEQMPVVGVERSSTDPSQVGFYRNHGLSSVDSVDLAAARAALVRALVGAEGTFGFKPSADEPLPEPPEEP